MVDKFTPDLQPCCGKLAYHPEKRQITPSLIPFEEQMKRFCTCNMKKIPTSLEAGHEDLKEMLDSSKDHHKLEAMKRIIGMIAKGKDASELFPAVVKNVVAKNVEVKKLVYVYLERYAEEQQDLALLSISTFQKALKDSNQLIRASALRVLSSIRVPMIAPIVMLAIKEACGDMSPYVRKTAAHAIPKLYSVDEDMKEELIGLLEKLLSDRTTLVAGSCVAAFENVCPERTDLIHRNYRKLCNLLVDVDEWGQMMIINMLTRYARTQFLNPHTITDPPKNVSDNEDSEDSDDAINKKSAELDSDHRLLLKNCRPLLQSRNSAVVISVCQLFYHLAPAEELPIIIKPILRLLRAHREVQAVVLNIIVSLSSIKKSYFENHLKSFYIRPSSEPTHIKLLKLEILTNLANESNIGSILKEFQFYVASSDRRFAAAVVQAIGRCANMITAVTEQCLSGLMGLMATKNEAVVAESVVVIKKLLQQQGDDNVAIIVHMAKIIDKITVPMARASILWLIGENCTKVQKYAPDVLRKMAKTFSQEDDIVKMQIVNLAAKLYLTNQRQVKLLTQYVFNLAKYDANYDLRDRVRLVRALILPKDPKGPLSKHAKKFILASKPAPKLESHFKDRSQFQIGSLSHYLNEKCEGYQDLPEWPTEQPDSSVRNVVETPTKVPWPVNKEKTTKDDRRKSSSKFYSDSEESDAGSGEESSGSTESSGSESESGDESGSGSASETENSSSAESEPKPAVKTAPKPTKNVKVEESSESDSSEDASDESDSPSPPPSPVKTKKESPKMKPKPVATDKKKMKKKPSIVQLSDESSSENSDNQAASKSKGAATTVESLLNLDDDFNPPATVPAAITIPEPLLPVQAANDAAQQIDITNKVEPIPATFFPQTSAELLNRLVGKGLTVNYRFTRTPSIYNDHLINVELTFKNQSSEIIPGVHISAKKLQKGHELFEFPTINQLVPGSVTTASIGIGFNDSTQPVNFTLSSFNDNFPVSISCPVGELLQSATTSEDYFKTLQTKLSGLHESSCKVALQYSSFEGLKMRVLRIANVGVVAGCDTDIVRFCARTAAAQLPVLISINLTKTKLTVNCEQMVVASMLLKQLKAALEE